jgi:hypothetical protein
VRACAGSGGSLKGSLAFRAFIRAKRSSLWRVAYFLCAALIFVAAAQNRFSLPQNPLETRDGYLLPALIKLGGCVFPHIQGGNFIYPGTIYLILRIFADFRVISVIQHLLGLIAGALFLASWSRLGDFFPKPRLNRVLHEAIGLFGAAIYLLSSTPVFLETQIRPDAVCMFFEMLMFGLIIQFFYYRVMSPDALKAVSYGMAAAINAFLLASLKPSFTVMGLFTVVAVIWLTLADKGNFIGKLAFFAIALPVISALTITEHYLRRNDEAVRMFLPETLFAIHANIIHAQMAADLKTGETGIYSREWLQGACDDLGTEIQRIQRLYPEKFPVLGFNADYLMSRGADPLLNRWRRQLGDEQFLKFLHYWYWHSVMSRPLAFANKIARQLGVFYSTNCPAFNIKKIPTVWTYPASFSALSNSQSQRLLAALPAGADFLKRTSMLRGVVIHQGKWVRVWNIWFARTYLAILLVSVPLAGWFLLKRANSDKQKWPAFFVIFWYSTNFGNVVGISAVHTMEGWRYSAVQFIAAIFAQLWAVRWLLEIALAKVQTAPTLPPSPGTRRRRGLFKMCVPVLECEPFSGVFAVSQRSYLI